MLGLSSMGMSGSKLKFAGDRRSTLRRVGLTASSNAQRFRVSSSPRESPGPVYIPYGTNAEPHSSSSPEEPV